MAVSHLLQTQNKRKITKICFLVMRTLGIYSLDHLHAKRTAVWAALLYCLPGTGFCSNWNSVPFDHLVVFTGMWLSLTLFKICVQLKLSHHHLFPSLRVMGIRQTSVNLAELSCNSRWVDLSQWSFRTICKNHGLADTSWFQSCGNHIPLLHVFLAVSMTSQSIEGTQVAPREWADAKICQTVAPLV